MLLEVVVTNEQKKNKGKGSCYVGNERKYPSMNSYGGKLVREKHDGQFRNIKKKNLLSFMCCSLGCI